MAKSSAQFAPVAPLATIAPIVTVGTIVQPARVGVTMAALKAALPDYYNAPTLANTIAQSIDVTRKFQFMAQALTRLALNSAHSGTVPEELTNAVTSLTESAKNSKGKAKADLLHMVTALVACGEVIKASKNAHKGADVTAFETFALECEGEFLSYLTPIKVEKAPKVAATKSALEKLISTIQAGTWSADDVTALHAALANVTPSETAPL